MKLYFCIHRYIGLCSICHSLTEINSVDVIDYDVQAITRFAYDFMVLSKYFFTLIPIYPILEILIVSFEYEFQLVLIKIISF